MRSAAGTTPGSIPSSANGTSRQELAYIRVPILIVQGEDDQYGTVRQIEVAREECYCPVEVALLPGVRHSPHREAPEATLQAIVDFSLHCCAIITKAVRPPRRGLPRHEL